MFDVNQKGYSQKDSPAQVSSFLSLHFMEVLAIVQLLQHSWFMSLKTKRKGSVNASPWIYAVNREQKQDMSSQETEKSDRSTVNLKINEDLKTASSRLNPKRC